MFADQLIAEDDIKWHFICLDTDTRTKGFLPTKQLCIFILSLKHNILK